MIILQTLGASGLGERLKRLMSELLAERIVCVTQRRLKHVTDVPDLLGPDEALICCHGSAGDLDASSLHVIENYRTKSLRIGLPQGTPVTAANPDQNILVCFVHGKKKLQHSYSKFTCQDLRDWQYAQSFDKAVHTLRLFFSRLAALERYRGIDRAFEILLMRTPSEKSWAIVDALASPSDFAETIRSKLQSVADEVDKKVGFLGATREHAAALDYLICRAEGKAECEAGLDETKTALLSNEQLVIDILMALSDHRNLKKNERAAPPLLYQLLGELSESQRSIVIRDADQYLRSVDKRYKKENLDITDDAIAVTVGRNNVTLVRACKEFANYRSLRKDLVSACDVLRVPDSVFIDRPLRRFFFGAANTAQTGISGANEVAAAQPIFLGLVMAGLGVAILPIWDALTDNPQTVAEAAPSTATQPEVPANWLAPYAIVDLGAMESTAVSFSPDGKTVVVGDDGGGLRAWNALTGEIVFAVSHHTAAISSIDFAPSGEIVVASHDGHVSFVDLRDGSLLAKATSYAQPYLTERRRNGWRDARVNDIAYADVAASGGWDGKLYVGARVEDAPRYRTTNSMSIDANILSIESSADRKNFYVLTSDGVVRAYRSSDLVELFSRRVFDSPVGLEVAVGRGLKTCSSSEVLVQATGIGYAVLSADGMPLLRSQGGQDRDILVSCGLFDQGYLATASNDRLMFVDVKSNRPVSDQPINAFGVKAHHARTSRASCCTLKFFETFYSASENTDDVRAATIATDGRLVFWAMRPEAKKWIESQRKTVELSSP